MLLARKKIFNNVPILLLIVYVSVFTFCLSRDAIYSYDTYDYLKAMPYRQLGYVIFVKTFGFIFGSIFDVAVVMFQTLFSLSAIHYFYNKVTTLFSLNVLLKLMLIALLIFPFFQPLNITNNICSEGLSYGLYLLFIAIGLDLLFNDKSKQLKYFALVYLALIFMRGQFFFTTLIFAFTYFLIHRKEITTKKHIINLAVFIVIPLFASLSERTYHKLKDGFFKTTPLGFVSASTAPFYLSSKSDADFIKNEDSRAIFELCYDLLERKNLLLSSRDDSEKPYPFFHNNLPKICNQTIHASGKAYFQSKNPETSNNPKRAVAKAYFDIEAACKDITISLIKANFSKWIDLYYNNISYGFYSPVVLVVVLLILIFSFIKTLFSYHKRYAIIFLLSCLTLSNAMLIAFASHSIMRYLFYNYVLLFLLLIGIIKLIKRESKY